MVTTSHIYFYNLPTHHTFNNRNSSIRHFLLSRNTRMSITSVIHYSLLKKSKNIGFTWIRQYSLHINIVNIVSLLSDNFLHIRTTRISNHRSAYEKNLQLRIRVLATNKVDKINISFKNFSFYDKFFALPVTKISSGG
jgi:hypothetical protein